MAYHTNSPVITASSLRCKGQFSKGAFCFGIALAVFVGMTMQSFAAEDSNWHIGAVDANGRSIDPHTLPFYQTRRVWQPEPSKAAPRAYPSKIVDYADKWTRHGFGSFGATCGWRKSESRLSPYKFNDAFISKQDYDVDGDGQTSDDVILSIPFSTNEVFSILDWPWSHTFPERISSKFYGGMSAYFANTKAEEQKGWRGELGINMDHSPPFYDTRAEDHPLNIIPNPKNPNSAVAAYWLFLWKKEDFLNTPKDARVTFDENSRLISLCTRWYWLGWDDTRMVVQDGEKMYLSDTNQFIMWRLEDMVGTRGFAPYTGRQFLLSPTKATWAEYSPQGSLIHFDASKARFAEHKFTDVRAVGWYIAKNNLKPGTQAHAKWYGFEADAVVTRPEQPSVNIDMKKVPGGEGVADFYIASCEVPYTFWRKVFDFGNAPHNISDPRYVYDKFGDMGSMRYGTRRHGSEEPVVNITWYDALAWCNTLSEYEGKTPCYYLDPEFTTVFRNDHLMTRATAPANPKMNPPVEPTVEPIVYVKWNADGYRLPTKAEWEQAFVAGGRDMTGAVKSDAVESTSPVGSKKPNKLGMHDMIGNVWELVWTCGNAYDPAKENNIAVMGGDFHYPDDPRTYAASAYGDTPYTGSYNIGIRPVCREKGTKAPLMDTVSKEPVIAMKDIPLWVFEKGEKTKPRTPPEKLSNPFLAMKTLPAGSFTRTLDELSVSVKSFSIGTYLVQFKEWQRVYDWAVAHGYQFSRAGDMGSMYWYDFVHGPDEPVTHLSWWDVIAWCNALSEMEGRKPFYYTDEQCTAVYRSVMKWRPLKFNVREYIYATKEQPHPFKKYIGNNGTHPNVWIFEKWDVDGYRLPTPAEYEYAVHGDRNTTYFWGNDPKEENVYAWTMLNSGGRTHPVGTKAPNHFGLYDIQGNVLALMNGSTYVPYGESRPQHLDINNPKQSMFLPVWQKPNQSLRIVNPLCSEISFVSEYNGVSVKHQNGVFSSYYGANMYFPDYGFRVVRCEAGTHPANGLEELKDSTVLKFDTKTFDPLVGKAYRGGIARAGTHAVSGLRTAPVVAWKFNTGGPLVSSPVKVGDTIYIGGADGFYAVDASNGKQKWKVEIPRGVESSACVANGNVYFGANDGNIYSVQAATGVVNWKTTVKYGSPVTSSPAVAYGVVFTLDGGGLGFDEKTGALVYTVRNPRAVGEGVSPALTSEYIVHIYPGANGVRFISMRTAMAGGVPTGNAAGSSTVAIVDDIAYVTLAAYCFGGPAQPEVAAARISKMQKLWGAHAEQGISPADMRATYSSPAVWNDLMFAGNDSGFFYAYSAAKGNEVWKYQTGAAVRSSPSVATANGVVYVSSDNGYLYAFEAKGGALLWKMKVDSRSDSAIAKSSPKLFRSSPWPDNDAVYVGSLDGMLYALGKQPMSSQK